MLLNAGTNALAVSFVEPFNTPDLVEQDLGDGLVKYGEMAKDEKGDIQVPLQSEIEAIIGIKALEFRVDANRALAIANCESRLNPNAVNLQGSSAAGLWMIIDSTMLEGIKNRGLDWSLEDKFDPWKATDMAMWYMAKNQWSRWECDPITNNEIYCAIIKDDSRYCE